MQNHPLIALEIHRYEKAELDALAEQARLIAEARRAGRSDRARRLARVKAFIVALRPHGLRGSVGSTEQAATEAVD